MPREGGKVDGDGMNIQHEPWRRFEVGDIVRIHAPGCSFPRCVVVRAGRTDFDARDLSGGPTIVGVPRCFGILIREAVSGVPTPGDN